MSKSDVDQMISATNQVVGALNSNDKNEATRLFNIWRGKYEGRPDVFIQSLDVMHVMALVGYNLSYPELPRLFTRYFETSTVDLNDITDFLSHMGPGTMVDVGAQWGTVLTPYVWSGWRVLAFEPTEDSLQILRDKFSGFRNLNIDTRAVSDKCQSGVTFYQGEKSNIRSLHGMHETAEGKLTSTEIEVTTLTAAFKEQRIDNVMFLKIDVEGNEMMVMQGLPWDSLLPTIIAAEYDNPITDKIGYDAEDMVTFLMEKGYHIIVSEWLPIVEYGVHHEWRRYTTNVQEISPDSWGNLLAFANRCDYERFLSIHNIS